jgi:hypothetical protein
MSYRDTAESLRAYRDRVAAELAEARRSAVKVDALEKELAETEALLRKAVGARALPVLEDVRIAAPCRARWEEMTGDDRVRFCGQCQMNVYNLSAMPRAEAEALLADREGRMCVRFYRRADGTVLTADCPVGAKRRRRRRAAVAAAVGSGLLAAGLASAGTATMGEPAPRAPIAPAPFVMGSIAEPAPPQPPPHFIVPPPEPRAGDGHGEPRVIVGRVMPMSGPAHTKTKR